MKVDTIHAVETPEGVELALRCAGPIPRAFAWLIDFIIRGTAMSLVGWALSTLGRASMGIFLVIAFAAEWLYPVFFEVLWKGRTPGKRAFGLVVVRDDGLPVDWGASFLRNLLRVADFLPAAFGAALFSMLASRSFKRLGDLAAGTIVVYAAGEAVLPWQFESKSKVPPHAPVVALNLEEQRSVIAFAARSRLLGKARADELATVAASALDGRTHSTASPTERVVAVATWLRESGHVSGDAGDQT